MNISAPNLSPLFRSDTQGEILARVFLSAGRGSTTAELARLTGASYATAHREIRRLVDAGLVRQESVGASILITAREDSPAYGPLVELLLLSYGPTVVTSRVLSGVAGITSAFIFGSWAARRQGVRGDMPVDIDVLVVGDPERSAVYEAAEVAEAHLGRDVNMRIVPVALWKEGTDAFVKTVKSQALIEVKVGDVRGAAVESRPIRD